MTSILNFVAFGRNNPKTHYTYTPELITKTDLMNLKYLYYKLFLYSDFFEVL